MSLDRLMVYCDITLVNLGERHEYPNFLTNKNQGLQGIGGEILYFS